MKTTMWLFWTQDTLKHRNKQLLCDVGRMKGKLILNENQKSSNPWTAVQTLFEVACWQLVVKFWSLVLTFQAHIVYL